MSFSSFLMFFYARSHTNLLRFGIVLILIGPRIGDPVAGIREPGGSFNSIPPGPFEAFPGSHLEHPSVFCAKQPRPFGASRMGPFETSRRVLLKHPLWVIC